MMNNNKTKEPYGDLLDKYLDSDHVIYEIRQQRKEEAQKKYGNLLDYAKPGNTIYEDMVKVDDMCRRHRQQRAKEYEQANIRRQEKIEQDRREKQERIDRHNKFVNGYLERKKAEQEAAEKKSKEVERECAMFDNIQKIINIRDDISKKIAHTTAMLKADEEKRREHEAKMEWCRKQERK